MQKDYTAFLEKSVLDLLQYGKGFVSGFEETPNMSNSSDQ